VQGIPDEYQEPWTGACAEPACLSQARYAGTEIRGGTMVAVSVGNSTRYLHGQVVPPCPSCQYLRDHFGYSQIQ
jgi:cytidine deaminase